MPISQSRELAVFANHGIGQGLAGVEFKVEFKISLFSVPNWFKWF